MAIDNKDKKVLKSSIEREQNEVACSAECEKIKGSKNLNVPPLRFPEFSGEWKCTTIGNIGDIKNGPFGSVLHAEDYVENGIPIVTTEHFKTGLMPSDKFGIPQVSNEDYIRLKGYRLETNDIVFSRVGSVDINAHVGIEQNGWLFSGRVLRVRPKYDIDSLFLHYALSTEAVKRDIRNRAVGQTMPSINTPILSSTTIQLPKDLFEQKKVAHFLRLLDERIITQNKIIEDLKKLKSAISHILFSSKGAIHLSEIANVVMGQSPSSNAYNDQGLGMPLVQGNLDISNGKTTPRLYTAEFNQTTEKGNIILTVRAPVGEVAKATQKVCLGRGVCAIIPHEENMSDFIYQYLTFYKFMWRRYEQGSTFTSINGSDVRNIFCPKVRNVSILTLLDIKINIEERVVKQYQSQKQYMLYQMFI